MAEDIHRNAKGEFASIGAAVEHAVFNKATAFHHSGDTADVAGAVGKAHDDIESHLSGLSSLKDDLNSAEGDRNDVEGELGPGEEYEEADDQIDYLDRNKQTATDSAAKAYEARDKLHALIAAAQKHLDIVNGHLTRIEGENEGHLSNLLRARETAQKEAV